MRLAQPDWLQHRLDVTGEPAALAAFCRLAEGSGVVPWAVDFDRDAEDWFHLMLAYAPASISAAGARILAGQLRDAVWEAHERAMSSPRRVPLDLHALIPVPAPLLHHGPDDPRSLAWLWQNWGTTWPLRRVERLTSGSGLRIGFCSADWTPWPALAAIRARFPTLRLDLVWG